MEYAAIRHRGDKNYCYALEKNHFLFRLQVKKGDVRKVVLHYRDKNIPIQFMDTRAEVEMYVASADEYHVYYEAEIEFQVLCLRYYFEIEDMEGKVTYYANCIFMDVPPENVEHMFNCPQELREEEMFETPDWAANKVVYQIFPSRFASSKKVDDKLWYKAPIEPMDNLKGDLRGIIEHLGYLKDLGVEVMYMTPIFKADTMHKYDTIDYYQIDSNFGTKEDLKELVAKAHEMGIKVLLDGVFNHTSTKFFAFADLLEKEEKSKYRDWYYVEGFPLKWGWKVKPNFKTFAYFGGMPKLNLSNREVQDYVIDVAKYWIKECNIDGWRLDVGDEISHKFWKRFREEVKTVKRDALIVGEIWYYAGDFLEGDEWDTVMNYHFYNAVMDLVANKSITVSEFVGRLGFMKGNIHKKVYPLMFNLIDSHDTARFLHSCDNEARRQKLAAAFQLLSPGMPMIYYGDEMGMQGGPDPDCRRGMVWDEAYQNKEMYEWYKALIRIRKDYPAITEGEVVDCQVDDEKGILAITRRLHQRIRESRPDMVTLLFHSKEGKAELLRYQGMKNLTDGTEFMGILADYEVAVLVTEE